jgi:polysaccharide biosynthesis/export protein
MNAERLLHIVASAAIAAWIGAGPMPAHAAESRANSAEIASCVQTGVALQAEVAKNGYRIQPGDHLEVFVRQEQSLQRQVLVLPDGTISLPLLGIVPVFNKTVQDIETLVCRNLVSRNLIQDPNVTISVQNLGANLVYIIGKVARPGEFELRYDMDVIKAIAVAGGLATFAKEGDIKILRRTPDGPREFKFDYGKFMDGHDRDANILLQPGDTIVVP